MYSADEAKVRKSKARGDAGNKQANKVKKIFTASIAV
jgi:hypothetical protein